MVGRGEFLQLPLHHVYVYSKGCMKDRVFATNPTSIEDLKATITTFIRSIDVSTMWKVFQNMMMRAKECLSVEGGHFKHLL